MVMNTITASPSQTLLFINPTKPLFHNHAHRTTLTFPPPTPTLTPPLRITHHSYNYKPHHSIKASLFPLHAPSFVTSKQAFSTAVAVLYAIAKRVATKISAHDFQVPLVEVAKQAGKWVDLFQGVLMIRVLLSWFPNLNWEIQPFSAIVHLTDPFVSLCRSILPPFRNVDVSVLLGFTVLGVLSNILSGIAMPPSF